MKEKSRSTEIKIVVDAKDNNIDCVATVNVGSIDLDTTIELLQICIDELTDEEIALKLGVSRRALYGIKPNAYFRIAIWSHQVAYIKENTYEFIFNYAGLYERLK